MIAKSTSTLDGAVHQEVQELLPWFVNGTLSDTEAARVAAHVRDCADCARELAQCRVMAEGVKEISDNTINTWQPSAKHFANLMRQVDVASARTPTRSVLAQLKGWFAWLDVTPNPARWALGLQGALVLMLAVVWLVEPAQQPGYQTMSSAAPQAAADQTTIKIVFADDITEKELRGLLHAVAAEIVAGPSTIGVYTLRMSNSGTPDQTPQTMLALRAHPKVRLAELVRP